MIVLSDKSQILDSLYAMAVGATGLTFLNLVHNPTEGATMTHHARDAFCLFCRVDMIKVDHAPITNTAINAPNGLFDGIENLFVSVIALARTLPTNLLVLGPGPINSVIRPVSFPAVRAATSIVHVSRMPRNVCWSNADTSAALRGGEIRRRLRPRYSTHRTVEQAPRGSIPLSKRWGRGGLLAPFRLSPVMLWTLPRVPSPYGP